MPEIITDDGISLHCEVRGHGPIGVVYLHPMAADVAMWRDVCDEMGDVRYRHVALDIRGHGGSICDPCEITHERAGRDVLTVADAIGLKRFAVVGQSMGGKIGLMLAAMAPERVTALVLLGSPGPGLVPFKREDIAGFFATYHDPVVTRKFFHGWFKTLRPEVDAWLEAFSRYPDWLLRATAEISLWTDIRAEIADMVAPTLVIAGADDPVYGPAYQETDVLPFLARAQMIVVQNCGHGLIHEQPAEIAAHIDDFLRRVALRE